MGEGELGGGQKRIVWFSLPGFPLWDTTFFLFCFVLLSYIYNFCNNSLRYNLHAIKFNLLKHTIELFSV